MPKFVSRSILACSFTIVLGGCASGRSEPPRALVFNGPWSQVVSLTCHGWLKYRGDTVGRLDHLAHRMAENGHNVTLYQINDQGTVYTSSATLNLSDAFARLKTTVSDEPQRDVLVLAGSKDELPKARRLAAEAQRLGYANVEIITGGPSEMPAAVASRNILSDDHCEMVFPSDYYYEPSAPSRRN